MVIPLAPGSCKALTVWQPGAHIISIGLQQVENRFWPVSYRGPLLIHSGSTWDPEFSESGDFVPDPDPGDPISVCNLGDTTKTFRTRRETPDLGAVYDLKATPFSCVVAVGELTDCHFDTGSCCGPYAAATYHWVIKNVRPLHTPIPTRGHSGLWEPTLRLCEEINSDSARMQRPTKQRSPLADHHKLRRPKA